MKTKNVFIIIGLVILGLMIFKPDFLSVVSEKNLIIFYNSRDDTTIFNKGDPLAIDTTFVQWDLDRRWNVEADRNQKPWYSRKLSGNIIWVDNEVYSRELGMPTAYGWTDCQSYTDWGGHGSEQGVCTTLPFDHPDCQIRLKNTGCLELYSDNYLNSNKLPSVLMTQTEKDNLEGCHEVKACVGRSEKRSQSSTDSFNPTIALQHTCTSKMICWDGTSEVINKPPYNVPNEVIDDVPDSIITPVSGGGCHVFN